ncbi:MAG TPA: hypothetical protein VKZ91_11720 [Woeseiaceae bacterium]|nr:hypothetical protein [Woeseiaceae bacterium]
MLPKTTYRVANATAHEINERIRREILHSVAGCAADGAAAIQRRLDELDAEWDTERMLEANASALVLAGLGLGASVDRKFYLLSAVVASFLLQHALQGWCPPLPVLRRLGVRTQAEIEMERYALKALRGDFRETEKITGETGAGIREVMQAVQR